jgi:uncharacterized membrane protein YsdA (DUF1294 family)
MTRESREGSRILKMNGIRENSCDLRAILFRILGMMTTFQHCILFYLLAINAASWAAFGIDKYKAKHHRWRVPEATLWLLALLGGAGGAWLGMLLFRHKTKHLQFVIGMPLMIAVNGAVVVYLFRLLQRL